jgi:hypothetical protein
MGWISKFIVIVFALLGCVSTFAEPVEKTKTDAITEPSAAKVKPDDKASYLICKNNSVVRTIRVEKKGHGCKTTYTKDGVDNVVGRSGSETLCYEVFDRIRDNLEKASWKCKDITESRVSTSLIEP